MKLRALIPATLLAVGGLTLLAASPLAATAGPVIVNSPGGPIPVQVGGYNVVASPASVTEGQTVTYSIAVGAPSLGLDYSGSVSFYVGSQLLCSLTAATPTCTSAAAPVGVDTVAGVFATVPGGTPPTVNPATLTVAAVVSAVAPPAPVAAPPPSPVVISPTTTVGQCHRWGRSLECA